MTGPQVTRIHLVVTAVIELMRDVTDLQVTDGPHVGEIASEAICVGFTDSPDLPGYDTTIVRQDGLGRPRMLEQFTIRSFLTVGSGDPDMPALRLRAATILGLIDGALRDEHHSRGVWDRAALGGRVDWVPWVDSSGGLCNVFFSIEGASFL